MPSKGERHFIKTWAMACFAIFIFGSCVSPKKITYFNYVPDSVTHQPYEVQLASYTDPLIQPDNLLQISVQTIDPQSTTMMGTQQSATYNTQASQGGSAVSGYLVDQNGEIELPLAGRIKVGGLTTMQARTLIAQRASQYYKNPVVNIRFANFIITVLGEVGRPGQIVVPNEKVSIFDALGMAGDLTIGGKRDEILLIREENGQKQFIRFSLNDPNFLQSSYFYLKQHDVLYVPPTKNKAASADVTTTRLIPFITVAISAATLLITILRF